MRLSVSRHGSDLKLVAVMRGNGLNATMHARTEAGTGKLKFQSQTGLIRDVGRREKEGYVLPKQRAKWREKLGNVAKKYRRFVK